MARDQDKRAQEAKKREMLILVHKHLLEEGLIDAATVLGNSKEMGKVICSMVTGIKG